MHELNHVKCQRILINNRPSLSVRINDLNVPSQDINVPRFLFNLLGLNRFNDFILA